MSEEKLPISDEVESLLELYSERKFISIKDIRKFSETYHLIKLRYSDVMEEMENFP